MPHRIEVSLKATCPDPVGRRTKFRIASDLGFNLIDVRVADAFIIDRDLSPSDLKFLVQELFRDPVIQEASIDCPLGIPFDWLVEVGFRPGVTDNVARTAREALERTLRIRLRPEEGVYTRKLYFIKGNISKQEADTIARDLLANDLIQTRTVFAPKDDREAIVIPRVSTRADMTVRG